MKNNPCENCIYNVDEYCRCEKLTMYETYYQGAKEFAEWLVNKGILDNRCIYNGEITDYGKVYLAEWQKEVNTTSDLGYNPHQE